MKKEIKNPKEEKNINKYNMLEIVGMVITLVVLVFATIYVNYNNKKETVKSDDKNALVTPTVVYLDNVMGTTVEKGTKVKVGGIFAYFGNKKFYYKAEMYYSNGRAIYNSACNEVDTSKVVNFSFSPTKEPIYARITTYKDSACKESIRKYDSREYKLKSSDNGNNSSNNNSNNNNTNKNNNSSNNKKASLKLTQPSKTVYTNKTVVEINFKHNGKERMYYTFTNYNKAESGYTQECSPIDNDGKGKDFGLAVDKNNTYRYSVIKLYSDSTCKTLVDSKTTKIYKYVEASSNSGNNNSNNNNSNNNNSSNNEYTSSTYAINPVKSLGKINNTTIKVEKGCNQSVVNKYIAELKQNPSYFVKVPVIYLISDNSMKRNWGTIYAGVTSGAMAFSSTQIRCNEYQENVMSHELAHAFDSYKFANYYSNNSNFVTLYNKYRKNNSVLTSYGRGNISEFFAEAYVYYLRTYMTRESNKLYGFGKTYPTDLKTFMEKALGKAI